MFKKVSCLLIILVTAIISVKAQELTLSEALEIGLENNYSIRTARNMEETSQVGAKLAYSSFLPVLDATGRYNFQVQDVNQTFVERAPTEINNAKSNALTASAIVTWTIFDGTKMFLDYNGLKLEYKQTQLETRAVIENTIGEIAKAYHNLVFERKRKEVFESAVELSEERLEIAKNNYELGRFSKTDYLSAKVDLNRDKSAVLEQDELVRQAIVNLNLLIGQDPSEVIIPVDTITVNNSLNLSQLREDFRMHNKQLLALMQQENILRIQNKTVHTELAPQIDLFGGYAYQNSNSDAGFLIQNLSTGFNYGLSLNWRIFNKLDRLRRHQTTKIALENNAVEVAELENQLLGDLLSFYVTYENKLNLIDLENANVEVAKENAEIAMDRYKLGRSNAIELRESQQNSIEAESRLLTAIYQAKLAEIDLLATSGNLAVAD
ncbi:membrane protein [Marivirga lumbricoides]|uniref:Membrane protein n=1 Tax=Marivirga lumbricoides TaxID=1046115 RepID=A0ABQ1LTY6_9BACT|nr:membrane protein [Marivirga lumbricoides]